MGEPVPRRLRWRPGVYVVRRDAAHLQAGLDPPRRVVLRDLPAVRATLRTLSLPDPADPDAEAALAALAALRRAGLLIEATDAAAGLDPQLRRAAEAQFGADAPRRLRARREARVAVVAAPLHRETAVGLLRGAGVGLARDEPPTATLVVTDGEPVRADLDPLVRDGTPHLVVAVGAFARVGPFVLPGRTACLRCVDAHLAEPDPPRPLVVELAAVAARAAGDAPVDPTLAVLALAWAVRDLTRFVEGDHPASWSATVEVDHGGAAVHREWARHPHCGCAWDVLC